MAAPPLLTAAATASAAVALRLAAVGATPIAAVLPPTDRGGKRLGLLLLFQCLLLLRGSRVERSRHRQAAERLPGGLTCRLPLSASCQSRAGKRTLEREIYAALLLQALEYLALLHSACVFVGVKAAGCL